MGQLAIFALAFFLVIVGSVFHGSEASVAYLTRELLSRSSYIPPSSYGIVLPVASEALSRTRSIDMEHHLSRMITPSMLAPNQPEEGYAKSSSPPSVLPYIRGSTPSFGFYGKSPRSNAPSPTSLPKGSILPLPTALPPKMGPVPPTIQGPAASILANSSSNHVSMEHNRSKGLSPNSENHTPHSPLGTVPIASPLRESPLLPPAMHPSMSRIAPTKSDPAIPPLSISSPITNGKSYGIPVAAPPVEIFNHLSPSNRSPTKGSSPVIPPALPKVLKPPKNASPASMSLPTPLVMKKVHSPASAPSPSIFFHKHHARKGANTPASAPSNSFPPPSYHQGPVYPPSHLHPPAELPKKSRQRPHGPPPLDQGPSFSPIQSPFSTTERAPSSSSTIPSRPTERAPSPSSMVPSTPTKSAPSPSLTDPSRSAACSPSPSLTYPSRTTERAPSPSSMVPSTPTKNTPSPSLTVPSRPTESAPLPSLMVPSRPNERPIHSPTISPAGWKTKMPVASPVRALPPPPPNQDCSSVTCIEPLTNAPPGTPCDCVRPMQVGLRLSVALYSFFSLVSELAHEIATGIFMKQSQVRIMGANAASQAPDKTIVLIDLVPLGEKFDNTTAFLTYEKFWHKQVVIKTSFFGDYEVLYVHYPGLPPSPPSATSSINAGQFDNDNNSMTIQPLGVDVRKRKQKERIGSSVIAIIVLSSAIALVLCVGAIWLFLWKRRSVHTHQHPPTPRVSLPLPKPSGAGLMMHGSWPSSAASASLSFNSSIATYTGSAKTFSIYEIEKATDNFEASKTLGEGGFGRVYRGILEDGTKVAVKVLKRDGRQGSREFLAEVEMLSRLHHRNLVKLIGICTEENCRCLVYELIPNGSVESHLHGVDRETAPLDWGARMKIALGSARGLAYLHEDSSPRVIHRDFKSSNILLEYDFTPKVSDFGLARTALDGGNEHISTRVMGTFGYVAPEYAMTGHLLVKSDVYSYGVVLLELLTGRKPVDMMRPLGQENLVTWARPLLTSKEGLETIIDPVLGPNFPFDSVAKVAAIASMCVQTEVSHRPFMGEVVQALKLVCNESDEKKGESEGCSQDDSSAQDADVRVSIVSGQLAEARSFVTADYGLGLEAERALSTSDIFDTSERFARQESGSFRRHSSSGPLRMGRNGQFWQRDVSRGSVSEHRVALNLWEVLDDGERWP